MSPFYQTLGCLAKSDDIQSWWSAPSPDRIPARSEHLFSWEMSRKMNGSIRAIRGLQTSSASAHLLRHAHSFNSKERGLEPTDSGHGGRIHGDPRQKTLAQANTLTNTRQKSFTGNGEPYRTSLYRLYLRKDPRVQLWLEILSECPRRGGPNIRTSSTLATL